MSLIDMKRQAQNLITQAYQLGENDGIGEGRNEAWEAAKKLMQMDLIERTKIFAEIGRTTYYVIQNLSASEAISKIKAYDEQKKQEEDNEIRVGDEITYKFKDGRNVKPFVVMKITSNECGEKYYEGLEIPDMKWAGGGLDFKKTGRTFPEIAEVLKKMQEDN